MTSQAPLNPIHKDFIHRLDQDVIDYHNTYLAWKPSTHNVSMEEIRATPQKFALPWHQNFSYLEFVQDMKIPSIDGYDLPVRIYHPDPRTSPFGPGPYPIHVNFHGGGFVFGDLDSDGLLCMMIRNRAGIIVFDVDYRLCPENKFLTGHDDAWAALLWLRSNAASFNGNPTSISIGGVSAGGHISAAMQQLAAANNLHLKLAFLNVPTVKYLADFDGTGFPSYTENQNAHFLNLARVKFFCETVKPKTQEETDALKTRPSYLYDPLSGNDGKFENICPTFIATADCDIIRDEGEAYGMKLVEAGTKVTMRRYKGAPHVFLNMVTTRNSKLCISDLCAELVSAHGGSYVAVAAPVSTVLPVSRV